MPLFQNSVLVKYQKTIDKQLLNHAYNLFKNYFHNATIQENIRNSKEEQFQEGFLNELFVKILGYTLNPNPEYNLITENKNVKDSKKADGAILIPASSREHAPLSVVAIIELKGTDTTDLGKIETQAFGYKNNQPECIYIITSNFEKLRFYIDNAIEYLEFNLFNLNQADFELLYTCLAYQNILLGLPKKLKDDSIGEENKVTKQLYTDYSLFKKELYQSLVDLNSQYEPLELFKKSQKLLDRFLFLFFAEDRNLLPPNSVRLILNDWKDLQERDEEIPLYNRFKKYFEYLNTGFKGKRYDVFAYNGGLFKPDEILDNVKINDDLLFKHAFKLSEYDFESEIDVNILGHIFENSLNELDEIKAQLEGQEVDKTKTKRKKDGVFYTPKYITKYIVDNTVGKLCTEKKEELNIVEAEYVSSTREQAPLPSSNKHAPLPSGNKHAPLPSVKKTVHTPITKKKKQELLTKLTEYRNWLLQLTICDPACGSGAFLNQALDFLITEHRYIDELQAKLFGDAMVLSDLEKSILENNLFGVDLNEESVEIAKLSLWLRTAQPNRKLNDLNNNIKCGNSLIDDPNIAGEKAFNWQTAFPQVFEKKEKIPYHITTAIHDSRTSDRMITYNVREKRANGAIPEPQVIWLTEEEETLITKTVVEIIEQDNLNVLAYNICRDHFHLLLVCEEQERDRIVQKIKAKTARAVNILRGVTIPTSTITRDHTPDSRITREHAPLSLVKEAPLSIDTEEKTRGEKQNSLWTQKYGCKEIKDEQQLNNTIEYIRNNRVKHELTTLPVLQQGSMLPWLYQTQEQVFRTEYKGGFDVIIGNPPYVLCQPSNTEEKTLDYFKKFEVASYKIDLFHLFFEQSIRLVKQKGKLGFITPNTYLTNKYIQKLRNYILKNTNIETIVNYEDSVFFDAGVDVATIILKKENSLNDSIKIFNSNIGKLEQLGSKKQSDWEKESENTFNIKNEFQLNFKNCIKFENIGDSYFGIQAFDRKSSISNNRENDDYLPLIDGAEINRYETSIPNKFFNFISSNIKSGGDFSIYKKQRIVVRQIGQTPIIGICETNILTSNTLYNLYLKDDNYSLKYVLTILNSKVIKKYWLSNYSDSKQLFPKIKGYQLKQLPIPIVTSQVQQPFIEKADQMLSLKKELQELSQKFQRTIVRKFFTNAESTREHAPLPSASQTELPKKLQDWYLLSYADFIKELGKKKVKLSLAQEAEWEEYFTQEARKAIALKQQIDTTDKEIDQMVYKLYELTDEEINIVEGG
jgi:type I restriction-modification system DNA methylase subunit/REP element-mobilizing transposase RayT